MSSIFKSSSSASASLSTSASSNNNGKSEIAMFNDLDRDLEDFCFGIMLIFTDRLDEAEKYFEEKMKDGALPRAAFGYGIVAWIKALMAFKEEDKNAAMHRLSESQKVSSGIVKQLRTMAGKSNDWMSGFGMQSKTGQLSSQKDKDAAFLLSLDVELLAAETSLFHGILYFMQESKLGYVRGAMELRTGVKEFLRIGKELGYPTNPEELKQQQNSSNGPQKKHDSSKGKDTKGEDPMYIDEETGLIFFDAISEETGWGILVDKDCSLDARVKGGVELGLGLLHVALSQLPPKAVQFIQFLGIGSSFDRDFGLKCLRQSVDGRSIHSPISCLLLLLFHSATLIFARGIASDMDTEEANHVLGLVLQQYSSSSLFRWFKGRILRGQARLLDAISQFQISYTNSMNNKGPFLDLCRYELAWCNMLSLNFDKAACYFSELTRLNPDFIPTFYMYLCAICRLMYAREIYFQLEDNKIKNTLEKSKQEELEKKMIVCLADVVCLCAAVNTTVTEGWNGKPIPVEAFSKEKVVEFVATAKASEVSVMLVDETTKSLLPVEIRGFPDESIGKDGKINDWRNKATTYCASLPRKSIGKILSGFFLPTLEMAYLWNGFVQFDEDQKRRISKIIDDAVMLAKEFVAPADLPAFTVSTCLFKATLIAEKDPILSTSILTDFLAKNQNPATVTQKWICGACNLELGIIHLKRNEFEKSREYLKIAEDTLPNEFMFTGRLNFRLRTARKEIIHRLHAQGNST